MRRGLLLAATGGCLVALAAPVYAVPAEPLAWSAADDALALLERAGRAAQDLTYRGTQMVSYWSPNGSTSAVVDVSHVAGQGLLVRVRPTPQSPGGAVYDDESGGLPDVVGFANGTLTLLSKHYEIAVEGSGEVAGRLATVVAVRRPSTSPTARYWIDRETSLPLRREVLDGEGRTVRESAFLDLVVGTASSPRESSMDGVRAMPVADGQPLAFPDVALMRSDGWHVPEGLASGLELFDARMTGDGDAQVLQLTYSDGVSSVSVFQQRGRLADGSVDGWREEQVAGADVHVQGAFPQRVVWAGDGYVFTVVAECPAQTLADLVGALPHGNPGPGIGSRLGNGIARVGSWFNPFA
ncbi:MAG TPA: sigma-E factor regulatory protein RseB domain-containing protein [Frankiaceae bacterium]|jgi:sigma-E factor negative regulatory protein RseB|nr:sigma-E factor regulatory protein RseB domain-containing protein [Frankiaceae bacterium]